jgi:predicted outer membrane repeat protein
VKIDGSFFTSNHAIESGGAISLSCDKDFTPRCDYVIQGTEFSENKA